MDPRYPVGHYHAPEIITAAQRSIWIRQIEGLPSNLKQAVSGLSDAQLDTPVPAGGLDGSPSSTSSARQPCEQLHPLPARSDRGFAAHQTV